MSGNNQKINKGIKKIIKRALYTIYLTLFVFFALEIFLRIYNPFHFRLKGDKIILPISQTTAIHNSINPKLDAEIVNSRNGLGFRGPELPGNFENYLSVITIGGSTTECKFLNDDKTWPYLTGKKLEQHFKNVWLNNAGFDGHSTYGHQVLLNDYIMKLHPKVVTFLVGINDVESDEPSFHDKLNMTGAYSDFKHFIATNSEVINLIVNFTRGWRAQKLNNTTQKLLILDKNNNLALPDSTIVGRLESQKKYLINYQKRIEQLIDTCTFHGINPVFITQPDLFGRGIDSVSGADLEKVKCADNINGKLLWQILEMYNDVTRKVCAQKNIVVIDLAELMPKNSIYYYDGSHFTNLGAEKVAEIISNGLKDYLATKYYNFLKK
jgi:lysophospholipase L1-like esterase